MKAFLDFAERHHASRQGSRPATPVQPVRWRFDLVSVPHRYFWWAEVSAAMDKKGRTSMVNNTLRQESGAVPRRIAIDSIRHMGSDSGKVLPNAGKRPNVAPITDYGRRGCDR
ncbi:hypothetical protein [Mesorhizobium sp.]|uniref:hypothetical protein n=1 Tax=Mesorhizobium sp. TaxID=1871066 RepID=UPI000FE6D62D|nr:hypothetical protein [Mesorhizobium sp.]RWD38413.1 MAG: hypothetical protein EOS34_03105 [Mesorhizobium sp.]RWD83839.1 MAG: hypothetical protein EOS48_09115 [Mesorhizobium sp.]TIS38711.1 MAG: hypothetical protein E5W95_16900 [Mesorhizobium sp.]